MARRDRPQDLLQFGESIWSATRFRMSTDLTAAFMIVATTQAGMDVRNNLFWTQTDRRQSYWSQHA